MSVYAAGVHDVPLTRAYLRANLMAASLASVPELVKKALSAKEQFLTSFSARLTCISRGSYAAGSACHHRVFLFIISVYGDFSWHLGKCCAIMQRKCMG